MPHGWRSVRTRRRRRVGWAEGAEKPGHLAYGEQTAGGSRLHTSLLILKIGNCIVVEGSHNYKVHVFRDSDRRAPRLFEKKYDCERIRLAPGHREQAHLGALAGASPRTDRVLGVTGAKSAMSFELEYD